MFWNDDTDPGLAARCLARFALTAAGILALAGTVAAEPMHGIAMHGDPAYAADFSHFDYVNPDAPKGGALTTAALGSFDSLNPFIVKGSAPVALRVNNLVFERLMARSYDEPFSLYGLIAETIETPEDRSYVRFRLRREATFSDGTPVTVDDVIFSLEALRDEGRPNFASSYGKVTRIERDDERTVTFHFADGSDREIPLIIGLMPVLPKHIYGDGRITEASLDTPIGSGPYVVDAVDPGTSVTLRRNPDYWGKDLAVNRGHYNFDALKLEYYRDNNTMFEAFKKGLYQFHNEGDPTRWATGYDFPAANDGRVKTEGFQTGLPKGMNGLVFNTRRPIFADVRVRQALISLFDFEWVNQNLYYGLFERTQSYFFGSSLSFVGNPASDAEKALLGDAVDRIPAEILDGTFKLPETDGSGRNRRQLRAALKLFAEAGYELRDGTLVNAETGEPFAFEMLTSSRDQERLALTYAKGLERAGITVAIRLVDAAQYEQRRQTYDYDMIQNRWYLSLSPGNEQNFYWNSTSAGIDGTRNYMGVADPAIDRMIGHLLAARTREELEAATRSLDRLLMAGAYLIPLFHTPEQWVARWNTIDRPDDRSLYGTFAEIWWSTEARE